MTVAATIAQSKYFRLIVGVIVLTIFLVTLMAAAHKQSSSPIAGMQVVLNSDVEYTVLEQQDLVQLLLQNNSINLKESSLDKLDLKLMEQVARTHPWVADANIFVDGKRQLQVHVRQREPVARIFDNNGRTYYLDQQMHEMPNLVGYNYPVPVFTKVPLWVKDSLNQSFREQIIALGSLIHADSFWNAQVTQIEVQADRTFILIPMVGDQRILFGDTSNAQAK